MRNIGKGFVESCLVAVRDCKEMRKIEKGRIPVYTTMMPLIASYWDNI